MPKHSGSAILFKITFQVKFKITFQVKRFLLHIIITGLKIKDTDITHNK